MNDRLIIQVYAQQGAWTWIYRARSSKCACLIWDALEIMRSNSECNTYNKKSTVISWPVWKTEVLGSKHTLLHTKQLAATKTRNGYSHNNHLKLLKMQLSARSLNWFCDACSVALQLFPLFAASKWWANLTFKINPSIFFEAFEEKALTYNLLTEVTLSSASTSHSRQTGLNSFRETLMSREAKLRTDMHQNEQPWHNYSFKFPAPDF